ncbi:MAG: FdtA/QdtA family cupin domain-containing protein [Bacteroidota bacterium]
MKTSTIHDCTLIQFSKNHRIKGNITAINGGVEVPFDIQRIYYLYDIPGGADRGGHAHRKLKQLIFAASGSFDLIIDDGRTKRTFNLSRPDHGVLIPPGLWRELSNFSSGSICLVIASDIYDEEDYIRDYAEFKSFKSL